MVTFSLQVQPENATEWIDTARRAEAAGFAALYTADPPAPAPHRTYAVRRSALDALPNVMARLDG
jgi:alkanesulfonate monooxygenase SsuD/methylene tetrahydromethanopterin reductase-like flavin-dependent oxidoreductase (luciferase family)